MFGNKPKSLGLGFTSTEDVSITLVLRALEQILLPEDVLTAWKIKVGSQYFPELVVNGLKLGVPMLRGGKSGDGKLRTAEISLAIREWGLQVAPVLRRFESRYSHVEPTGAGLPRIDFWASSAVARWYFPLLMYGVFSETVANPVEEFTGEN
ncbi:MAG: hypothetical protein HKN10_07070 [Myxococcales bacterium]|nr:hypothetical protein [Myxococcales bacterium]